jgi:hypothetical protein
MVQVAAGRGLAGRAAGGPAAEPGHGADDGERGGADGDAGLYPCGAGGPRGTKEGGCTSGGIAGGSEVNLATVPGRHGQRHLERSLADALGADGRRRPARHAWWHARGRDVWRERRWARPARRLIQDLRLETHAPCDTSGKSLDGGRERRKDGRGVSHPVVAQIVPVFHLFILCAQMSLGWPPGERAHRNASIASGAGIDRTGRC